MNQIVATKDGKRFVLYFGHLLSTEVQKSIRFVGLVKRCDFSLAIRSKMFEALATDYENTHNVSLANSIITFE